MRVSACFGFQQPLNYAPASAYSSYGYYPGNNGGSNGMPYIAASAAKSRMASNSHIFADKNLDTDNFIDYNSDKLSTCKRRFADHRLQCAYPFDRRVPITETECEQLCVKNLLSLCQSYQFDSIGKVCELYDIVPSYNEEDDTELTSFRKADDPLPDKDVRRKRFTQQNGMNAMSQSLSEMSKNIENLLKIP